jgi:acyl-CoA thioester hydrolase
MNPRHEHAIQVVVHADHIDELDHVNNAVYLNYVEQVARAHSDSLGFTVARFLRDGGVPVVRRHSILYHHPARDGDLLTVHTRVLSMRGVRAVRGTRITCGEILVAEVETEWVWVEPTTSRPIRIPKEVHATFLTAEQLETLPAGT